MSESFEADWLRLREPFDAAARNTELARRLDAMLPTRPRLLDLGAGTGSLFRWLAPIIRRAQSWTLVEADAGLIDIAFEQIALWAENQGWVVTFPRRAMLIHAPQGAWRVEALHLDLADAAATLPLDPADAVVCSALLDLVSASWLERLCADLRCPLLAFLTVDGRIDWLPRHELDRVVASAFRRDQAGDKGFGPALGARAPAHLAAALARRGFTLMQRRAEWTIPRTASDMLQAMLAAQADVAAERLPHRRAAIAAWHAVRLRERAAARLAMRIGHLDCLALPASEATANRS